VLVDFRKEMTEEEYQDMQKAVETDTPLDRELLEKKFYRAIEGMKMITDDYWNIKTMREYFWNRHEEHLSKDLPEIICRLCVVKKAKLVKSIEKDGKVFFRAELEGGEVRVVMSLYSGAEVGDTAMVHYGYAVEKVGN
jgi:hypothetical protein